MVEKEVWLDLVVDLRSAVACGTIGTAPQVDHNDLAYNRICQEVKDQVIHDFRGWTSKEMVCTQSQ